MIVALEGEVIKKEPTYIYLKVYGVTYKVNISLNSSAQINEKNISLHITQVIKEDSNNLYGFLDINEKHMFEKLIKINGVGVAKNEALMALESLGFKKESINKVLNLCTSTTTSELVKEALKQLGK